MQDRIDTFRAAVTQASAEYDADIYFYSGAIDDHGFGKIVEEVGEHKSKDNAVLILTTNGGLANSAYQIARFFQQHYERFIVFCPGPCKSAGTLIVLGAHALVMDVFSELGPLDVQLVKQDEIAARKSGLLSNATFDALADSAFQLYERLMFKITLKSGGNVGFKLASELSANMASTMLAPVYAQINPEVVGSENRDLDIATEYGNRLAKISGNAGGHTVDHLVKCYPSHDFIIDVEEASELFHRVSEPSENLYTIIGMLGEGCYQEAPNTVVAGLTEPPAEETADDGTTANENNIQGGDDAASTVDGSEQSDRTVDPGAPELPSAGPPEPSVAVHEAGSDLRPSDLGSAEVRSIRPEKKAQ